MTRAVATAGGVLLLSHLTVAAYAKPPCATPPARLYIVRHAEKAKRPPKNPPLTTLGKKRARALVNVLEGIEVDAIYATQYKRTQQTVEPLANARGQTIRVVKSGQMRRLVRLLSCRHADQTVLVSGHSFTLPALLRRLGVEEKIRISESDYGDLYVVSYDEEGHATLEIERFGP